MPPTIPAWPSPSEISNRIVRLRENMARAQLDVLLITSQDNFEYFTGFRSLYWLSSSRPFFGIVRRDDPVVRIIMSRMEGLNDQFGRNSEVQGVFYDGFTDAAMDVVRDCLKDLPIGASIGLDYGQDVLGRGSLALTDSLRAEPGRFWLTEAADIIWLQRSVKSEQEIDAKRTVCKISTDTFFTGLDDLTIGITEYEYGQLLKQRLIGLGADSVDWLPVRFMQEHKSPTQPNSDAQLQHNDFVWVDFGTRRGNSISDLNRIAKVGKATSEQERLYSFVRDVTLRVAEGIRPGMTGGEAFKLFHEEWTSGNSAASGIPAGAGRVGHGSGVNINEPPSLMPESNEIIHENMILHFEPKVITAGGIFQTEEVFRVGSKGGEFISDISPEKLPIIDL